MRIELSFVVLVALAGCHSAPPLVVSPPAQSIAPSLDWQEKNLRQQQHIRALIAQNEALHSRNGVLETTSVTPVRAETPVGIVPMEPVVAAPPETTGALSANAEGVIDLTASATAGDSGGEVNPFAVRSLPADAVREITLHVSGLIEGATPCAVVNGRTVEPGDTVETLKLERIGAGAAWLRHGPHLLRLPVAETPVRVRLVL